MAIPRRRLALGTVAALAGAAVLGWFLLLRSPGVPTEAEGRAWLAAFADRLTSPQTWAARGPSALALFPGLGPWSNSDCVLAWSQRAPSAPVVTYQRLELGRLGKEPCDQAQFGMLSTTLRHSEGITPGALAARFTEQFGSPDTHRDTALQGSITYTWQVQDGIFAHLEEKLGPGAGDTFSLLFMRSYASPTHLASPAEAAGWVDRTVDLVTGPDLAAARGGAVVRLLNADMQPAAIGNAAGCPTTFDANLLTKGPIATGHSLMLERSEGAPCEEARFSWLSMRIWQREPVTAARLVQRIESRLGSPTISRDFGRNGIKYDWTTPHGTVVQLSEDLSPPGRNWLSLRTWRP